jgi:chlorophyll synthase
VVSGKLAGVSAGTASHANEACVTALTSSDAVSCHPIRVGGLRWPPVGRSEPTQLGPWGFAAAALGLLLAWAYSAPPFRLKRNGWFGNAACSFSYEGLAWLTGAAVMVGGAMPDLRSFALAGLYSVGAHGIMTLNDFKAIAGDRAMGIASLPVQLGVDGAAHAASLIMALSQVGVVVLLAAWGRPIQALWVGGLLIAQVLMMERFTRSPVERALWYSGFGVPLFVSGMLVSAFALRGLIGAGS